MKSLLSLSVVLLIGCTATPNEQYPEVILDADKQCAEHSGVYITRAGEEFDHHVQYTTVCDDGTTITRRVAFER